MRILSVKALCGALAIQGIQANYSYDYIKHLESMRRKEQILNFYGTSMKRPDSYQNFIFILKCTQQSAAQGIFQQWEKDQDVVIGLPLGVIVETINQLSEIVKENRDFSINIRLYEVTQQLLRAAEKSSIQNHSRFGFGPSLVPASDYSHDVNESSYPRSRSSEEGDLPKMLKEIFYDGKQLVVNVRQPKETVEQAQLKNSKYLLPPKGKAYAFIVTMIQFERQSYRQGAQLDTTYMTNLMKGLGFEIFPEDEEFRKDVFKTKADIQKELEQFYVKCKNDEVDCFLVFFSSHGYNDIILTSDEQPLNFYTDIIYKFQALSESKRVAMIFFNNSCQTDPPFDLLHSNPYCGARAKETVVPDVKDTIYLKAQLSRSQSNRDTKCGSYLVIILAYVFMEKAHNTSLLDMLDEVQQLVTKISREAGEDACQICPYIPLRLESPFYFFTN